MCPLPLFWYRKDGFCHNSKLNEYDFMSLLQKRELRGLCFLFLVIVSVIFVCWYSCTSSSCVLRVLGPSCSRLEAQWFHSESFYTVNNFNVLLRPFWPPAPLHQAPSVLSFLSVFVRTLWFVSCAWVGIATGRQRSSKRCAQQGVVRILHCWVIARAQSGLNRLRLAIWDSRSNNFLGMFPFLLVRRRS